MIGRLDVFVGVASIPSREASLQRVVERLLPQARQIGVYLNGYDSVPRFLRRRRIVVARSQDHGDIRDNGKFFFLNRSAARYYATVDDDLIYPHDYLKRLVACLNEAGQRAAVGVHGAIYPSPIVELFDPRYLIHFANPSPHAMPVHLLGTGTTLIDQSDWKLDPSEFGRPGMADIWFAAAAAKRNAPLFVTRRIRSWVSEFDERSKDSTGALFYEGLLDNSLQVDVLREAAPPTTTFTGLVRPLLHSSIYSDELSLHQALELDRIRSQLGYPPLSEAEGAEVEELLRTQRGAWSDSRRVTTAETRSLGRLVTDILSDRISSSAVIPVLDLLDRLHDVAVTSPQRWNRLPPAVRYDSSPERVERLEMTLVERAMHRSRPDAQRLWAAVEGRAEIPLSLALEAERASIATRFARLPAFTALARENPDSAAARLYDYFEAVDWQHEPDIAALQKAFESSFGSLDIQMLVCVAAARSGNRDFAMRTASALRKQSPWDGDVRLLEASLSARDGGTPGDAIRPLLRVLDDALEPQRLTPFRALVRDGGQTGHWIHHLTSGVGSEGSDTGAATVSVLMTTYNDRETIGAAVQSILASEGVDLQLVVVDDASTDDTPDQLRSIDDPRITLVRNDVNQGPYLSRNRGLEYATGEYVAIADGDDWSHPQRLQYQASVLGESPHLIACKVAHVRLRPNGVIDLENHLRFVGDGPVSLMFRRWLVDHIGGFDHVRTRGDIEYLRRITARFGPDALASFATPLLLATSSRTSNSKRFREESLNLYRTAARAWHERRALSDGLYVPLSGSRAPFMAPHDLLTEKSPPSDTQVTTLIQESAR